MAEGSQVCAAYSSIPVKPLSSSLATLNGGATMSQLDQTRQRGCGRKTVPVVLAVTCVLHQRMLDDQLSLRTYSISLGLAGSDGDELL